MVAAAAAVAAVAAVAVLAATTTGANGGVRLDKRGSKDGTVVDIVGWAILIFPYTVTVTVTATATATATSTVLVPGTVGYARSLRESK